MQKIIGPRKESKPGPKGGTVVALFDDKGTRFSAFAEKVEGLQDVQEGDTVEADIRVDGKFNNIITVKVLSHGNVPDGSVKEAPIPAYELAPSNRRNNALNAVISIITATTIKVSSLNELLIIANKIDHWMETGEIEKVQTKTDQPKAS